MREDETPAAEPEEDDDRLSQRMGIGICFGLLFGVVLSVLMDNWAMIGVGLAMAPAFALLPSWGSGRRRDGDDGEP